MVNKGADEFACSAGRSHQVDWPVASVPRRLTEIPLDRKASQDHTYLVLLAVCDRLICRQSVLMPI